MVETRVSSKLVYEPHGKDDRWISLQAESGEAVIRHLQGLSSRRVKAVARKMLLVERSKDN
jgi:hypothetical protein